MLAPVLRRGTRQTRQGGLHRRRTTAALIARQKLEIAKLKRQIYGPRSERTARLLDQMELELEELEADATEDEIAAEARRREDDAASRGFTRKRPSRQPFPEHLPRERVVVPAPAPATAAAARADEARRGRHRDAGGDPAPVEGDPARAREDDAAGTARRSASRRRRSTSRRAAGPGPNLLAMLLFEKFGQHQPLNRQAERYAREGVPLCAVDARRSGRRGCVRAGAAAARIEAHVFAAERLHGDDTTVPVLAKGKTDTGRCWVYVRDDRPFGGGAPPAAMFYYSRDRGGEHPRGASRAHGRGMLQADAYGGYNKLYAAGRTPGPILEAACWAHARRPFFALADIEASARRKAEGKAPAPISPLALETVQRIDALFEIERGINGKSADERRAVRQELSRAARRRSAKLACAPSGQALARQRSRQGHGLHAKALARLHALPRRRPHLPVRTTPPSAALRGIALGRKSWLFAGSDRGGQRAAAMYSLIVTAKMNDIDPQAWLADVLARIAEHPAHRLDELLPWNWQVEQTMEGTAQAA